MDNNNSQFPAGEWDWRPLARLSAWCLFVPAAAWLGLLPGAAILHYARELILLWLIGLPIVTRLMLIVGVGALRLTVALESLAFRISDWLVVKAIDPRRRHLRFASALGLEIGLAVLAVLLWTLPSVRLALVSGGAR